MSADGLPPQVLQLVYASAATYEFSSLELEGLLFKARSNNQSRNISGVLLQKENSFLQVLEGEPEAVRELFTKISADPRHSRVKILAKSMRDARVFADWSMGFVNLNEFSCQLEGFIDVMSHDSLIELEANSPALEALLNGFKKGAWRQAIEGQPVEL